MIKEDIKMTKKEAIEILESLIFNDTILINKEIEDACKVAIKYLKMWEDVGEDVKVIKIAVNAINARLRDARYKENLDETD